MEVWVITDWMGCIIGVYSTAVGAFVKTIKNIMGLERIDDAAKRNAIVQLTKEFTENPNEFHCSLQEENEYSLFVERVEVDKD